MIEAIYDELTTRAEYRIPGGVNSPVRAFRAVGGHPIFIESARGSQLRAVGGREYTDYVGSWGPAILGHAHPKVVEAVSLAATRGLSFGAPTELEVRYAEAIAALYPSIDMLRCVSSGTEATMSALRLARGFTGREKIVKFDGAYHGHSDQLLVKAGSGAATFGVPDSAGVSSGTAHGTLVLPYNDRAQLRALFRARGSELAAVIVEPVAGNMGCVPPQPGFLEDIVSLCSEHGALSIFDEVMTGCRVALGGAQERYGLKPDLTCLGKVIGGGMPLAVFGGRRDVMSRIAPLGPVYQAGTLSGNPVAVSAGLSTLGELSRESYARLERSGERLAAGLERAIKDQRVAAVVQRVGSMFTLFFHGGPVKTWDDAKSSDTRRFALFHKALLRGGVYWPPSQFEAAFISLAHNEQDLDQTLAVAAEALQPLS